MVAHTVIKPGFSLPGRVNPKLVSVNPIPFVIAGAAGAWAVVFGGLPALVWVLAGWTILTLTATTSVHAMRWRRRTERTRAVPGLDARVGSPSPFSEPSA